MNDRIKLAEAMGWKGMTYDNEFPKMSPMGKAPGAEFFRDIPDPFTDANDDYAVLEWGVDNLDQPFILAVNKLVIEPAHYTRGDYARAVLKVLD